MIKGRQTGWCSSKYDTMILEKIRKSALFRMLEVKFIADGLEICAPLIIIQEALQLQKVLITSPGDRD